MKKKVAQVITLSEMGGAQKHVYLLTKALIKRGYEVDVIASGQGELAKKIKNLGVNFIEDPYMVREINLCKDFKNILFLKKLFKEKGYDVVHCHSSKAGLIARISSRLAKVKNIIYTAHGFVFNEPMSNLKKNIYIVIEFIGSKFGKKIIAVSEKDYKCAKSYHLGTDRSLYCIGNAIEDIDFEKLKNKDKMKDELNLDKTLPIIGMVSNFYETKGHRYLIEALKKLYDNDFKFYTLLAGEGPTMEEMIEKANGYNFIKFLGYRKDNLDLINIFDVFILSSVKEGMPYVALEAMGLGKTVISTKVGALPTMIKNKVNGILINPKSSDEIYEILKGTLNNKYDLGLIGNNARDYINENYSFSKFIDDIVKIYEV